MCVIDKQILKKRFSKNFKSYNQLATVQLQIASKLSCLLSKTNKTHFSSVLEIGCGTGFLTHEIIRNYAIEEYVLNDLVETIFDEVLQRNKELNFNNYKLIGGDAETITFPKGLSAIFSSSTFQWFNNIEQFLAKTYNYLDEDGIIAFSTFGENNFNEIRTLMNIGLKYTSLSELCKLMNPNFEIIHAEEWIQQEQFQSPKDVLKHMKLTGVNGIKKCYVSNEILKTFDKKYRQLFTNKDKFVSLTYHPIIIIAKKK